MLCGPLVHIFSKSAETGIINEDYKFANITAIHKKGSRQEPGNYRLISLTSVVCKTMEIFVKGKIITHVEGNNLIGDSQHVFRNKRSCLTRLLDFFVSVIDTYDVGNIKALDLIYLGFQKAFDKITHERLLVKAMAHDIQGSAAQWIRNWLARRLQRVCINHKEVFWGHRFSSSTSMHQFADDTKLCNSTRHPFELLELEDGLNSQVDWANKWQMNVKTNVQSLWANASLLA